MAMKAMAKAERKQCALKCSASTALMADGVDWRYRRASSINGVKWRSIENNEHRKTTAWQQHDRLARLR